MRFRDMPKLPLAMILVMFVVGAIAYPALPARIPTHWGPSGHIDAWAAKSLLTVFMMPLFATGLYLIFWAMPYFDPKRGNLLASKQVYRLMLELVTGLFGLLYAATLLAAHDAQLPVDRIIMVGVSLMFIVLGNYLGRVKRNWTMGVRYSWTLSDDTVWIRTNRLGGRLFMLAGALGLVGSPLPAPWHIVLLLVPTLSLLPITYAYSMRLYRQRHPEEMEPPKGE